MPRSQQQFEKLREQTKHKIMAAALRLFAERGFHTTTVAEIAKKAGVAAGLLYNYFDGKDALLTEIVKAAQDDLRALIERTLKGDDRQNLLSFTISLLSSMKAKRESWRILLRVMLQPDAKRVVPSTEREFEGHLAKAVQRLSRGRLGKQRISKSDLPEILHAVLMTYLVTENEALARKLAGLLFK